MWEELNDVDLQRTILMPCTWEESTGKSTTQMLYKWEEPNDVEMLYLSQSTNHMLCTWEESNDIRLICRS
ncbi:hypothetical protein SK128_010460 [Halocaridina rubra]|uniref:Uncharacterized protein n=1 Tax=Halocaridina rubra TaxID=373956 RepID=A0AAN9AGL5_HALRR